MTSTALQLALLTRRPQPEPFRLSAAGWCVAWIFACAVLSAVARCL